MSVQPLSAPVLRMLLATTPLAPTFVSVTKASQEMVILHALVSRLFLQVILIQLNDCLQVHWGGVASYFDIILTILVVNINSS